MSDTPEPSLVTIAIKLAEIGTNVTTMKEVQAQHGSDIRALMARRWPLPVVSACIGVGGLAAIIVPHLK